MRRLLPFLQVLLLLRLPLLQVLRLLLMPLLHLLRTCWGSILHALVLLLLARLQLLPLLLLLVVEFLLLMLVFLFGLRVAAACRRLVQRRKVSWMSSRPIIIVILCIRPRTTIFFRTI